MAESEGPEFEKEIVQLGDGRQLVYYRFPKPSPRQETPQHTPDSPEANPPRER